VTSIFGELFTSVKYSVCHFYMKLISDVENISVLTKYKQICIEKL